MSAPVTYVDQSTTTWTSNFRKQKRLVEGQTRVKFVCNYLGAEVGLIASGCLCCVFSRPVVEGPRKLSLAARVLDPAHRGLKSGQRHRIDGFDHCMRKLRGWTHGHAVAPV